MSISSASSSSTRTSTPTHSERALLGAFAALSILGSTGCTAHVRGRAEYSYQQPEVVYEEPVVYVQTVPVDIESHPRVYYRGSYVYYVDGGWYSQSPRGWVTYRSEPVGLRSHRVDIERRYPRVSAESQARVQVAAPRVEVQAPRVEVQAPRVEAHVGVGVQAPRVEAHGRVGVQAHGEAQRRPARPHKR